MSTSVVFTSVYTNFITHPTATLVPSLTDAATSVIVEATHIYTIDLPLPTATASLSDIDCPLHAVLPIQIVAAVLSIGNIIHSHYDSPKKGNLRSRRTKDLRYHCCHSLVRVYRRFRSNATTFGAVMPM
jgi:hypothetical protein